MAAKNQGEEASKQKETVWSKKRERVSVLPREQNHVGVVNHLLMFVPSVLEGTGTSV